MEFKSPALLVLLATLGISFAQIPSGDDDNQECWEKCFHMVEDDAMLHRYKPAYYEFYDMGMEARRLKNMRSVDGSVYLLDSTLSQWHDPAVNPNLQGYETAESIWEFERRLAVITAIMEGAMETQNPIAYVQFNDQASWTCSDFSCLSRCEFGYHMLTDSNYWTPVQLNATSRKDANVEPSCRLGYLTLHDTSETLCTASLGNEMAVLFANSDFHSHVHESDEWDDYSPCDEHFDTRYAIGTHAAEYHQLKDWSSLDAHAAYIKDSQYTQQAAIELSDCMMNYCCASVATSNITPNKCVITTDHFGENIEDMTNHPYYA